jgi:hypothetical protein
MQWTLRLQRNMILVWLFRRIRSIGLALVLMLPSQCLPSVLLTAGKAFV